MVRYWATNYIYLILNYSNFSLQEIYTCNLWKKQNVACVVTQAIQKISFSFMRNNSVYVIVVPSSVEHK